MQLKCFQTGPIVKSVLEPVEAEAKKEAPVTVDDGKTASDAKVAKDVKTPERTDEVQPDKKEEELKAEEAPSVIGGKKPEEAQATQFNADTQGQL